MLINPVGTDVPYDNAGTIPTITLTIDTAAGAKNNLSYGCLEAKNSEWKNKINSAAPLLADRNINGTATKKTFWNNNNWEGDVVWGDTHVSWESGQNNLSWPTTTINGTTNVHDDLVVGGGGNYTDAKICDPKIDG